jgi:hypothetical protein
MRVSKVRTRVLIRRRQDLVTKSSYGMLLIVLLGAKTTSWKLENITMESEFALSTCWAARGSVYVIGFTKV